jgi:DNA-binding response OmpR family regulator
MSSILIVEDEPHIAQGLRFNLQAEGHAAEIAETGEAALDALLKDGKQFDAVVLDVMLPGKDGFTVARELREAQHYVPVLMLTARGRPEDVLKGFESGADDYLPKPFNLEILLARIRGLIRRKNWPAAATMPAETPAEPAIYRFGDVCFSFEKLQVRTRGQTFQLTLMEGELLHYLLRHNGRPVARKEILEEVWNLHEDTETRAIDNFIVRLRRYIEPDAAHPRFLITVRGLGYQFQSSPPE